MLLGSGHRSLGALLVPSPEALELAGGDVNSSAMRQLIQASAGAARGGFCQQQPGCTPWQQRLGPPAHLPTPLPGCRGEVARVLAGRPPHEHVRAFAVLEVPFAVEDGTLMRIMKPSKQAIFAKYAEQVAEVERQLR